MSEPPSPISSFLEEARQLDLMEAAVRDICSIEGQRLADLQRCIGPITTQTSNGLVDVVGSAMSQDFERRSQVIDIMSKKLSELPISKKWKRFQEYLNAIAELEKEHKQAEEQARKYLVFNQFWAKVPEAKSWLDVRLPELDLEYRRVVSRLNAVKDEAFSFYVHEQDDLRSHHLIRFAAIQSLMIELYPERKQTFMYSVPAIGIVDPGDRFTLSPMSDAPFDEMILGPFSHTRYINYLNGEIESVPVFGSSLGLPNGSRTLAKDILLPEHGQASPLSSVFTSVNPGNNSVRAFITAAFSLETVWLQTSRHDTAIASITRIGASDHYVDKGWLLGFTLVNLPKPLIQLERTAPRGVSRRSIGSYINHGTEECDLFLKIWPYTDGENIRLGADAITQMKDSEKLVEDIRTKWNPDVQRPLPVHQKLSSNWNTNL